MLGSISTTTAPWLPSPLDLIEREAEEQRQRSMGHAYAHQLRALGQQSQSSEFKGLVDIKV